MNGVMIPSVSAGASQRVASVVWTPHVIVPSRAAGAGPAPPRVPRHARDTLAVRRLMVDPPPLCSGISRATPGGQPANWAAPTVRTSRIQRVDSARRTRRRQAPARHRALARLGQYPWTRATRRAIYSPRLDSWPQEVGACPANPYL